MIQESPWADSTSGDGLVVEPDVGLFSLQGPGEGARGSGVNMGHRFGDEAGIHRFDLVLFAGESGFQVVEGAPDFKCEDFGACFAAQLAQHARLIVGVDLLSARGGAKQAGDPGQPVGIRLDGEGFVACVDIGLALIGGQQVLDSGFVSAL